MTAHRDYDPVGGKQETDQRPDDPAESRGAIPMINTDWSNINTSINGVPSVRDAALTYIRRGLHPIPVPFKSKSPALDGWPDLRLAEADLGRHFPVNGPSNLGLLTGVNGHVVADLDSPEALAAAPHLLPSTALVGGRHSTPRSHLHYVTDHPRGRLGRSSSTRPGHEKKTRTRTGTGRSSWSY
jgi:Bifunctional DNA primase/polymerase, N-terminal